jgi:pyruvate dehydrogenase (quinone)/pyruvate oxidase
MAQTGSDLMVETLIDWGVDTIFGMPGDGINGIMEALRQRQDEIRFIQVRHEEAAALMACAHGKWTGRLGVCLATSGPGGIHLLNGLYDAKLDGQPVLAITGLQFHDLINTHTQQDVELDKLFIDVCVYNSRIMSPTHVQNVVELACRTALAYHGVSHITMPVDVQSQTTKSAKRSKRNIADHVSDLMAEGAHTPTEDQVARAAAILNAGRGSPSLRGAGLCTRAARWKRWPNASVRQSSSPCSVKACCRTRAPIPWAAPACLAPGLRRRRWKAVTRC